MPSDGERPRIPGGIEGGRIGDRLVGAHPRLLLQPLVPLGPAPARHQRFHTRSPTLT